MEFLSGTATIVSVVNCSLDAQVTLPAWLFACSKLQNQWRYRMSQTKQWLAIVLAFIIIVARKNGLYKHCKDCYGTPIVARTVCISAHGNQEEAAVSSASPSFPLARHAHMYWTSLTYVKQHSSQTNRSHHPSGSHPNLYQRFGEMVEDRLHIPV